MKNLNKYYKVIGAYLLVLFVSTGIFAQIPTDYYKGTELLTGAELKTALHNIIKNHVKFPYTAATTDTWDILKVTDRDPNNPANVILIYSGVSVNAAQEYNNANGWTREHVWAKSRGDLNTDVAGPGTDVHNLRPEDDNTNSARSNNWFDYCSTSYNINGVPTGNFYNATNHLWEPRDAVKGDIARIIFYMDTRYEGVENGNNEPNLQVIDYIPADYNTHQPIHAKLSTLLEWNQQDPPDDFERNRNEVIFKDYQKNRNPFIDFPELADRIWGADVSISEIKNEIAVEMFPNPSNGSFTVRTNKDNSNLSIRVLNAAGMEMFKGKYDGSVATIDNVQAGIYSVIITSDSGTVFRKLIVVNN